jgi:preprotein translocase subunit SecD
MRNKSLGTTVLILAILLVFVYGIFGIPKGIGLNAWKTALTDRIHLGLDLKGGIHLVLQVMVELPRTVPATCAACSTRATATSTP